MTAGEEGAGTPPPPAERGLRLSFVEAVTALVLGLIGGAAIWDSLRIGAGWGQDGPRSGTFPLAMGVLLSAVSLATLLRAVVGGGREPGAAPALFATWGQLREVARVLLPTIVYVAAIPFTGIYLASALLVVWFMRRLGDFGWARALAAGLATAIVAFLVFETWFLVALPKGPIEHWLGF
jgi:hypothetical protein